MFFGNRKQRVMSERAQERKIEERLAVAKPRSACLVSRSLLSTKLISSLDSGAHGPSDQEFGKHLVFVSAAKFARDRVQNVSRQRELVRCSENQLATTRFGLPQNANVRQSVP